MTAGTEALNSDELWSPLFLYPHVKSGEPMAKGWPGIEKRKVHTADEAAHPWVFRCPKSNCFYAVSAQTEEEINRQAEEHPCPYQGGITKIAGSITMALVEDMWAKADAAFCALSEEGIDADEYQRRRGVVRGMAEMIAIFMPPHFRTGDEVARELIKRSAADADYETPGIGSRRYERPPGTGPSASVPTTKIKVGDRVKQLSSNHLGTVNDITEDGIQIKYDKGGYGLAASVADLELVKAPPLSAKAQKLSDKEIAAIKYAYESKMFTEKQIAETYGILPSEVKAVISI